MFNTHKKTTLCPYAGFHTSWLSSFAHNLKTIQQNLTIFAHVIIFDTIFNIYEYGNDKYIFSFQELNSKFLMQAFHHYHELFIQYFG